MFMIDCYRILGISYSASSADIRAAYLAKMKALHPDRRPSDTASEGEASEVTFAYWHLRDPARRAEHDRLLFQLLPPQQRKSRSSRRALATRGRMSSPPPRRSSRSLKRVRAATGVAAFTVAGAAAAICFTYLPASHATASGLAAAVGKVSSKEDAPKERRKIDPNLAMAATGELTSILRNSGPAGAKRHLSQCLIELETAPSLTILDYCVAFENSAARWEQAALGAPRYFANDQRLARYREVARALSDGTARDALMEEVAILAAARM